MKEIPKSLQNHILGGVGSKECWNKIFFIAPLKNIFADSLDQFFMETVGVDSDSVALDISEDKITFSSDNFVKVFLVLASHALLDSVVPTD